MSTTVSNSIFDFSFRFLAESKTNRMIIKFIRNDKFMFRSLSSATQKSKQVFLGAALPQSQLVFSFVNICVCKISLFTTFFALAFWVKRNRLFDALERFPFYCVLSEFQTKIPEKKESNLNWFDPKYRTGVDRLSILVSTSSKSLS